jgi:hypothetical protein
MPSDGMPRFNGNLMSFASIIDRTLEKEYLDSRLRENDISIRGPSWTPLSFTAPWASPIQPLSQHCKIFKDVSSLFVLEFFYRFGFDLTDSFTGNAHHITYFFQRKWSIVAGNPCAVQE